MELLAGLVLTAVLLTALCAERRLRK